MRAACLLAAAGLLIGAAIARADEATDALNQLYGDDLKRVLATPSPADDIALAKQLLDAAKKVSSQPAFLTVLCEKAYELAAKDASGYPTATAAMDLLAETVGDKKVECLQKWAALYQKQYAAARGDARTKAGEALLTALSTVAAAQAAAQDVDGASATLRQAITIATAIRSSTKASLQAQLDGLAPQAKMEKQLAALKAKLEAKPDDAAARKELVRLYLVELDNPAEAAKFVDESLDEATKKYVPAAAKPLQEAPEMACKELGEWYRGLADQAAAQASKGAMLRRAQVYYERFLNTHSADDIARATATLMLKRIQDALAKFPAAKPTPGDWIDCLQLGDLRNYHVLGRWLASTEELSVRDEDRNCRVSLPAAPTGSYEMQISFVRMAGDNTVFVMLPVGPTACGLVLSAASGAASGLEAINGKWAGTNETAVRPGTLVNGQEYLLAIKVMLQGAQADISATLDGKPFVHWKGPTSALSVYRGWEMPNSNYVGVGACHAAVVFRRVQIRSLTGEVKVPAAKPAPEVADKLTGAWTDCLRLIDKLGEPVTGHWGMGDAGLIVAADRGCRMRIPVLIQGSYQLQAKFIRRSGTDAIAFFLPVGGTMCNLTLSGYHGQANGIEMIDGQFASTGPGGLVNGQQYTIDIFVRFDKETAEIAATLDGRPLLRWKGPIASLTQNTAWPMPDPRCPGLGAWLTDVQFRSVQMRALPDDVRLPAEGPDLSKRPPKG